MTKRPIITDLPYLDGRVAALEATCLAILKHLEANSDITELLKQIAYDVQSLRSMTGTTARFSAGALEFHELLTDSTTISNKV